MHVTRFAGKVEAAKGERAERRHAEKLEHLREQKRDEEGRQRDDRAWWTAAVNWMSPWRNRSSSPPRSSDSHFDSHAPWAARYAPAL